MFKGSGLSGGYSQFLSLARKCPALQVAILSAVRSQILMGFNMSFCRCRRPAFNSVEMLTFYLTMPSELRGSQNNNAATN